MTKKIYENLSIIDGTLQKKSRTTLGKKKKRSDINQNYWLIMSVLIINGQKDHKSTGNIEKKQKILPQLYVKVKTN